MCKITQLLWKSLAVSHKIKHALPYDPEIALLYIYPGEMNSCSHTNLHINVHSNFICNHTQKL